MKSHQLGIKAFEIFICWTFQLYQLMNFLGKIRHSQLIKFSTKTFFNHVGSYDLILEQNFFCVLDPKLRTTSAQKVHEL